MELNKDNWELTLKELRNQRTQATIALAVIEASIIGITKKAKEAQPAPKRKKEERIPYAG